MIVVIVLLGLIAAVVVAMAGVARNGSTRPLSANFVISGQRLNGLSIRQLVSYGIAVRLAVVPGPGTRKRLRAPP